MISWDLKKIMDETSFFNFLDYIFITVMLISCGIGFFRGFTKEMMSVLSWIFAGFISVALSPFVAPYIKQIIKVQKLSREISSGIVFTVALAVLLTISSFISKEVQGSYLSHADRSVGVVFGLARSMIIIMFSVLFCLIFEVPMDEYKFIRESMITSFTREVCEEIDAYIKERIN